MKATSRGANKIALKGATWNAFHNSIHCRNTRFCNDPDAKSKRLKYVFVIVTSRSRNFNWLLPLSCVIDRSETAAKSISSVITRKTSSVCLPNDIVIGTSAASRPNPNNTRPIRRRLCRASKAYHRPCKKTSNKR